MTSDQLRSSSRKSTTLSLKQPSPVMISFQQLIPILVSKHQAMIRECSSSMHILILTIDKSKVLEQMIREMQSISILVERIE